MSKQEKTKKTFLLRLTKLELTHLRDLFSIVLPTELRDTVSQKLAAAQNRNLVEAKLWQKLANVCVEANLTIGDDAPDFVISANGPPSLGVFELAHDVESSPEPHEDENNLENIFNSKEV